MNQEDIQKTLEAISKSGITVAGDLVLEKKVEYEVNNVENGGIGIQIINGEKNSQSVSDKKELSKEQLARAIENCQEYFWAKSAYAVLFCLLRDECKKELSQAGFERMVVALPYKNKLDYECSTGTIANAFSDNSIYTFPVSKWEMKGASERIITLLKQLRKELQL